MSAFVSATSWSSLAGWMVFSLAIGCAVTLAALAAHDAQRAANRPTRWVWMLAIAAIVGLTLTAPLRRLPSPTRVMLSAIGATPADRMAARVAQSPISAISAAIGTYTRAVMMPIEAALQVTQQRLQRLPVAVPLALTSLWLVASVATLGVFVVSYRRVRTVMRAWPLERVDDIEARIAPSTGPAVIGLAPSEIVLPEWLLARPRDERRLVLAHEMEHVRALDPWLLVLACGAVALMPWHPALWFALSRLRLAVEVDCDQRVLRHGVATEAYGSLLIDLSAARPALSSTMPSYSMPAFSCSGSYLERRLVAMTSRPSRFASSRRIAGGMIAALALATACESKLPTSAEINQMDAKSATAQASKVALMDDAKAVYIVDGQAVSADAAKKLSAEQIASVSVTRADKNGVGEIRIVTNRLKSPNGEKGATMLRRAGPDSSAPVTVVSQKRKFDGLLIIDGKITESSAMETLPPESIASVEVVKGAAAQAKYSDPRALNGVIIVITKPKK